MKSTAVAHHRPLRPEAPPVELGAERSLPQLLARLKSVVPDDDHTAVDELIRRATTEALRILVVGEAKRGKSTLINALLGRALLPSGVAPLTAVATTVVHDLDEHVDALFADGHRERLGLDALAGLVTESANPGNERGVADVVAHVAAPLLAMGVELVDTPGVGSVYAHNTDEAVAAYERMDVAIFVLTVDPPISESERALLRRIRQEAVTVFCVLNKIDQLAPDELAEARAFTERVLAEEPGAAVPVWAVSARAAQQGDYGFADFRAALTGYLATARTGDLTRSVATRAERLARSVTETQDVTLAALAVSQEDLELKLAAFAERLEAVRRDRAETHAVAAAELARLLVETNEQAAMLRRESEPRVVDAVRKRLQQPVSSTRTLEQDGLNAAALHIQDVVDAWRERHAGELDAAINALDHRAGERLQEQIAAVRETAATLFGLVLPAPSPPTGLTTTSRFAYRFTADPGNVDALAAAVRHRLPGGLGRRQVSRYVLEECPTLLDRHIGRARADFQDRLTETGFALSGELDRQFDVAAGRLADAVTAAGRLRAERSDEVDEQRTEATRRRERAAELAAGFAAVVATRPPSVSPNRHEVTATPR